MSELLDIVDENDVVIGQEDRAIIHRDGLLHREINLYFVTPSKKLIFQIRKPKPPKRLLPLLDATVGGHVDLGETHEDSAIRETSEETSEETGFNLSSANIIYRNKVRLYEEFPELGIKNNVWKGIYAVRYDGAIEDLLYEKDKVEGFIELDFDQIANPSPSFLEKMPFIEFQRSEKMLAMYRQMLHL